MRGVGRCPTAGSAQLDTRRPTPARERSGCPGACRSATPDAPPWLQLAQQGGVTAEEAADVVIAGMQEERFLITTGDDTRRDFRHKAEDFDSWISQLQAWHDQLQPDVGPSGP
jgi:hypothetical protein